MMESMKVIPKGLKIVAETSSDIDCFVGGVYTFIYDEYYHDLTHTKCRVDNTGQHPTVFRVSSRTSFFYNGSLLCYVPRLIK